MSDELVDYMNARDRAADYEQRARAAEARVAELKSRVDYWSRAYYEVQRRLAYQNRAK